MRERPPTVADHIDPALPQASPVASGQLATQVVTVLEADVQPPPDAGTLSRYSHICVPGVEFLNPLVSGNVYLQSLLVTIVSGQSSLSGGFRCEHAGDPKASRTQFESDGCATTIEGTAMHSAATATIFELVLMDISLRLASIPDTNNDECHRQNHENRPAQTPCSQTRPPTWKRPRFHDVPLGTDG